MSWYSDMTASQKASVKEQIKRWRANNPEKMSAINRRAKLRYKYGMSVEDYDTMYDNQNGCCKICDKPKDKLCIDHCHSTGLVRGLLCHNCNTLLGHIENKDKMEKVQKYLNEISKQENEERTSKSLRKRHP